MANHINFDGVTIMTTETIDVGPREDTLMQIQVRAIAPSERGEVCEVCGERDADYMLDATADGGLAMGECQQCVVWSFDNRAMTDDKFVFAG